MKGSKLGDRIREVYKAGVVDWYNSNSYSAFVRDPWVARGGGDGGFHVSHYNGASHIGYTSRIIIAIP